MATASNTNINRPKIDELAWFIRMRWLAVGGQLVLVTLAESMITSAFAFWGLLATIGVIAVSNFSLQSFGRSVAHVTLGRLLVFDVLALTVLLYFSGGASNPFGFFYVLHVALAAILLGERWTWIVAFLCSLLYGLLFFYKIDLPELSSHHAHGAGALSLHLQGMWVAFSIVAFTLAFFFTRIIAALKSKDEALRHSEQKAMRSERLAAVTALAATAAHELNTPLATIQLSAEELVTKLGSLSVEKGVVQDAGLILSEVKRCSEILQRLRDSAADVEGQTFEEILIEEIVTELTPQFRTGVLEAITFTERAKDITVRAPRRPLSEALKAIVKNALESSDPDCHQLKILIDVSRSNGTQKLIISDNGCGMSEALLQKVGEPFFTTKPTGRGLGLGVFLARSFAESLGGKMQLSSREGVGTEAILEFPVH